MYDWEHDDWGENYFDTLDIVNITGAVLDGNNWKFYAPEAGDAFRTRGFVRIA